MAQFYLEEDRKDDAWSLPNLEVFQMTKDDIVGLGKESYYYDEIDDEYLDAGFYYWFCFPGCLPEGEPSGPYKTEDEALKDARNTHLE